MMTTKNTVVHVWSEIPKLAAELRNVLPSITVVEIPAKGDDEKLKNAKVLLADAPFIGSRMYSLPSLQWAQCTFAGVDGVFTHYKPNQSPPSFQLTKYASEYFAKMMAEWMVAEVISCERKFIFCYLNQKENTWRQKDAGNYRTLAELTVGILGIGSMGKEVARSFKHFGSTVHSLSRSPLSDKYDFIDQHSLLSDLPTFLSECDVLCSLLPSTSDTFGLLGNGILRNCSKRSPILLNAGRGDLISEDDLVTALNNGWLSHAIFDVFEKEPLPLQSGLWQHPKVIVSPHVAANSFPRDVVNVFKENLERYESEKPLHYKVDWIRGY